jgi:hypothetical protein
MKKVGWLVFAWVGFTLHSVAQPDYSGDTLLFQGQFSAWSHYNSYNQYPVQLGGRYIPQLNYQWRLPERKQLDLEASANIYGNSHIRKGYEVKAQGKIKPYRGWARFSSTQFELRAGLQKINFGSASMLRPLMWFDRMDPRDPLQLTDGVWGLLGRYYFLNNANIWLWGLYGNHDVKGWEMVPTRKGIPEFGGRMQMPIPSGEAALTYHYRQADSRKRREMMPDYSRIPEHRLGIDARVDVGVGLWIEGAWAGKMRDLGPFTHQQTINVGMDYTFGIGNGLGMTLEHLLAAYDETAFAFDDPSHFSAWSFNYPVGLFDRLFLLFYHDWTNDYLYSFFNWERQYQAVTLHLMAYWNPLQYNLPLQGGSQNFFAGKGIQIMFVLNH